MLVSLSYFYRDVLLLPILPLSLRKLGFKYVNVARFFVAHIVINDYYGANLQKYEEKTSL